MKKRSTIRRRHAILAALMTLVLLMGMIPVSETAYASNETTQVTEGEGTQETEPQNGEETGSENVGTPTELTDGNTTASQNGKEIGNASNSSADPTSGNTTDPQGGATPGNTTEPMEDPTPGNTTEPQEDPAPENNTTPQESPAIGNRTVPGMVLGAGDPVRGAITTWAELQAALNAGGTVTLSQDIAAGSTDNALIIPDSSTVTLDLNGYTIDRGLTPPRAPVIRVQLMTAWSFASTAI